MNTIAARDAKIKEMEASDDDANRLLTAANDIILKLQSDHNFLYEECGRPEQALRAALHTLETAQGYWVTDQPQWVIEGLYDEGNGPAFMTKPDEEENVALLADSNTYHRQDFSAAIATVKEALGE